MEEGGVDPSDEERVEATQIRLSDVELPFKLEERNARLAPLDSLFQEYTFHGKMIFQQWGGTEALIIGIGSLSIILGAWDWGIGEISSGGDYKRWGFFGDDAGFLYVNDFSLMLALLSLIAWIGFFVLLWIRFPLMRENLVWLTFATFAVQVGYILSHSSASDFPFGADSSNWVGVVIANLVLVFLAIIVVHRAVIETRDIHVEERHSHPDPRVVRKAWRDHSLKAWSVNLATWMVFLNFSSWAGAHAVSPRPPIENDMTLYVVIYALFGIFAMTLLVHVLWYPQFMLGAAGDKIQSVRAREVAGEFVPQKSNRRQGSCPICGVDSVAVRNQDGSIQVPCSQCEGNGSPGTTCAECNAIIPARISCRECGSSTTVMSHFSRSEAW
ncbi:MAG: hypothetical protein VYB30_05360 [Candidatus Thermoplasmatota archaeon]|nr:hypothetical protein [Candidatus Thermoplasmatota archaeon]